MWGTCWVSSEMTASLSMDAGAWNFYALQWHLCAERQGEASVLPRSKLSYLLVESSSSESKKLVVSSSLLMSVEELSYPPRSRRRSPFTVPFTLGAVKQDDSACLRQTTGKHPLSLCRAHGNLLRINLAIRHHPEQPGSESTLGSDPFSVGYQTYPTRGWRKG